MVLVFSIEEMFGAPKFVSHKIVSLPGARFETRFFGDLQLQLCSLVGTTDSYPGAERRKRALCTAYATDFLNSPRFAVLLSSGSFR